MARRKGGAVKAQTVAKPEAAIRKVQVQSGNPLAPEEEHRFFETQVFETEPAYIRVNIGTTNNLGDYESLRLDVSLSVPCYKEEINDIFPSVADKAYELMTQEVNKCIPGKFEED